MKSQKKKMELNQNILFTIFSLSLCLQACGEEEIQLKPGKKLRNVLENFEDVQTKHNETVARETQITETYKGLVNIGASAPDSLELQAYSSASNSTGLGSPKISFEGGRFNFERMKALAKPSSSNPTTLIAPDALWIIKENTIQFRKPDPLLDEEGREIAANLGPIQIVVNYFKLEQGQKILTDGRDISIIAEKIEIDGEISTQPLSPDHETQNGRDAGDISIAAHVIELGPQHLINANGGNAGNLEACYSNLITPYTEQEILNQLEGSLLDSSEEGREEHQIVSSLSPNEEIDRLGVKPEHTKDKHSSDWTFQESDFWEGTAAGDDFSSKLIGAYMSAWQEAKISLGSEIFRFEDDLKARIAEFSPKVVRKEDANLGAFEHWQEAIKAREQEIKKQNSDAAKEAFWIGKPAFPISLESIWRFQSPRIIHPEKRFPFKIPLTKVSGFRAGGAAGQVKILASLDFAKAPIQVLHNKGKDTKEEVIDWQKNFLFNSEPTRLVDLLFAKIKKQSSNYALDIYESVFYKVGFRFNDKHGDRSYAGDHESIERYFGNRIKETIEIVPEFNSNQRGEPEVRYLQCEEDEGIDKSLKQNESAVLIRDNQAAQMPEHLKTIGLSEKDMPNSFLELSKTYNSISSEKEKQIK